MKSSQEGGNASETDTWREKSPRREEKRVELNKCGHSFCAYLPAVVEVPVGVHLQLLHLLHLIQHLMDVEFGHQELEAAVSVRLTVKQRLAQFMSKPELNFFTD